MELYQNCSNHTPRAQNGPAQGGHGFYIGLYWENMKKSSCLKPEGLSLDIWYVASSSGALPKLFKSYPWGPKLACPGWSRVLHRLILGKHEKIFLSETTRPRALILGMKHHLVDLYQLCSNDAPGAKNGPTPRSHVLHRFT